MAIVVPDSVVGIGGSLNDSGQSVATDTAGNYYLTGGFRDTVDFDLAPDTQKLLTSDGPDRDIFVAKYRADRSLAWARRFGGPSFDNEWFNGEVQVDATGHVYVLCDFRLTVTFGADATFGDAGPFTFTSDSTTDHVMLRFDTAGKLEWATWFGGAVARGFVLDGSNPTSVYVAGSFSGTRQFGSQQLTSISNQNNSADGFVSRLDAATGAFAWTKTTGGKGDEVFNDIVFNAGASGSLYLTGNYNGQALIGSTTLKNSASFDTEGFVAKADLAGNFNWTKTIAKGGGGSLVDATMVNGDVVVTGYFNETHATFGNIRLTNRGPGADMYLASLSPDGNVNWAVSAAGVGSGATEIFPRAITADASGNLFVAGTFDQFYAGTASAQFGPDILVSSGNSDLFVSQLNGASGEFLKSWRMGGTLHPMTNSCLTVDAAGNLWMTGSFSGSEDFPNGETLTSVNNSSDIFLLEFLQRPPTAIAAALTSLQTMASADKPARINDSAVLLDAEAVQQLLAQPESTWTRKSRFKLFA